MSRDTGTGLFNPKYAKSMRSFLTVKNRPLQTGKLLIMKLTALFLLFFTLNVSATGFGQDRISLSVKKAEISGVLRSIEKQTTYRFLYNDKLEDLREKVSVKVVDANLSDVLSIVLQNTRLLYQVMENNLIVIRENPNAPKDVTITGKVTDDAGAPLAGASVTVKGLTGGTTTNAEGVFTITAPDANATLVISSIGFAPKEIELAGRTADVNVQLVATTTTLDQVVVIGYGTANKRDLTGSIVSVKAKDIQDRPSANPLALLQGKVAGVSVVNSGRVGQEPDVRIRGTNSVNGAKPVYIVDGILNDNINFLNPSDIETMEILKDPSSLAIFGVRGANGAIAITTKKAKAGQLLVNFNSSVGVKRVQDRMKLTNASQFRELYDEQLANQGSTPFNYQFWNANTDWQDEIFQDAILNYNNISITGSTEKNRFYMGIGYISEEGVIKSEKYKKYTFNLSDELKVSKALKFGVTINGYRAELPYEQSVGGAIRAAPVAPVRDPASGVLHTLPAFQRAQVFNPLLPIEVQGDTRIAREYRLVGSIYGEVDFLRHFNFRAQLFADYGFNTERTYSPIIYVYNPDVVGANKLDTSSRATAVSQGQSIYPKTQMDYLLNYKNKWGDHEVSLLGGVTTYYTSNEITNTTIQQGSARIIPNDPRFWYTDQVGDPSTRRGSGSALEDASLSYLARGLYNFRNKYLLNASFRRDGSSQFYRLGNQWSNFGAVGAGWVVSQEDFFGSVGFLDYLKVKGSWGVLGSKNIGTSAGAYPAYPVLSSSGSGVFGNNIVSALAPTYLVPADLNWERVNSWEAGFETRALNNALTFEAAYYSKETKGIITQVPGQLGNIPGLGNLGNVTNRGFEFSASYTKSITKDLVFTVSGNFTTIRNDVKRLNISGYEVFDGPARTTAGFPIGSFYGYVHDGVYQTDFEILKSPANTLFTVRPGDIKYKDVNGDGQITVDDRTIIGNPTPDFIYGGSLGLSYKGLDLGIDVQGVYGNEIYRAWNQGTFADFNYLEDRTARWNGIGTSNWEPILNTARANNYQNSSYWIEDGSFFRIRNIQIGYRFSTETISRLKLKSLRVFLNAQNIGTFANNTGYTPELGGSATQFGVDNASYPVPAIYTAGFTLNF
ncbi:MAG: SusC/RagA family TonB-linked outer membrane protein [Chitinophagaceae bacterium]|nr:MAG: SusC/RagA family TonB-linked outer membrane protein [Chitinophagaceae bacterium]